MIDLIVLIIGIAGFILLVGMGIVCTVRENRDKKRQIRRSFKLLDRKVREEQERKMEDR